MFCPERSKFKRKFYKTRSMYFSIKDEHFLKVVMEFEKKLAIPSKGNLIVNLHIINNI